MRTMMSDSDVKPLTLDDKQVLGLVYDCYVVNEHGETFDSEALFSVVSDIIVRSFRTCDDPSIKYHPLTKVDKNSLSNLEPPIHLLKDFACQMRKTQWHEHHTNDHETTMSMLRTMDSYSWCAKAVTALAAFALEYGVFWHLYDQKLLQRQDSLGNSLAVLSNVHDVNQSDISHYNVVLKHVSETVDYIVAVEKISKQGYDVKDIPTLGQAMQKFPVFVYWTVLTIVILAAHMDVLLGYTSNYKLSDIGTKIYNISKMLSDYLTQIKREKDFIDEYRLRGSIAFQSHTQILEVLKCLLLPREDLKNPHVYDGSTGSMVSLEVFRQKYVLLFLSGFYSIADEIRLLKSIHEGLKKDPKEEIKGVRKEDFKILWVPIVDDHQVRDNTERKQLFEDLKRQMDWYVVDYSIIPPVCKKLIRDRLEYQNKPMIPVFDPQGHITNENALHMLFSWDHQAFPWGKDDDSHLITKWNWFWSEMKRLKPETEAWRKEEAYIVIYGRTDVDYCEDRWLLSIPEQLEKVKRDEITKRSDVVINYFHHGKGKDEVRIVNGFWAYVEDFFYSMKKKKTTKDPSFEDVKNFLGLRQEQTGWVLVSKGDNVKLLCRGDTFYQTLKEFDHWKLNIEKDPGFDVSFHKHYQNVFSKLPHHANCLRLDVKNHAGDILSPIYCMCGRHMDIKLVRYVCCHEDKEEPVDARANDLQRS